MLHHLLFSFYLYKAAYKKRLKMQSQIFNPMHFLFDGDEIDDILFSKVDMHRAT